MTTPGQVLDSRLDTTVRQHRPEERIEILENGEQSLDILGSLPMDDVEILRRDRCTVKYGGNASDHDELDPGVMQNAEQCFEVGCLGV